MQEIAVYSWVEKIPWRRHRLPTQVFLGFLGGSVGQESACNAGDLGSVLGLGRSPGGGRGSPLWYSCLENPHGQRNLVGYSYGVTKSDTTEWLSTAQHRHHWIFMFRIILKGCVVFYPTEYQSVFTFLLLLDIQVVSCFSSVLCSLCSECPVPIFSQLAPIQ